MALNWILNRMAREVVTCERRPEKTLPNGGSRGPRAEVLREQATVTGANERSPEVR